jgi:hypothetical protein
MHHAGHVHAFQEQRKTRRPHDAGRLQGQQGPDCLCLVAGTFFLGLLSAWLGGGPQHDRDDAMFAVG